MTLVQIDSLYYPHSEADCWHIRNTVNGGCAVCGWKEVQGGCRNLVFILANNGLRVRADNGLDPTRTFRIVKEEADVK